jgi:hypothetical protein
MVTRIGALQRPREGFGVDLVRVGPQGRRAGPLMRLRAHVGGLEPCAVQEVRVRVRGVP